MLKIWLYFGISRFGCILYLGILQVFCINFIRFEIKNIPQPGADLTPQALLASRDAVFGDYFPDHSQVFKSLCNEDIRRDGQAARRVGAGAEGAGPRVEELGGGAGRRRGLGRVTCLIG